MVQAAVPRHLMFHRAPANGPSRVRSLRRSEFVLNVPGNRDACVDEMTEELSGTARVGASSSEELRVLTHDMREE